MLGVSRHEVWMQAEGIGTSRDLVLNGSKSLSLGDLFSVTLENFSKVLTSEQTKTISSTASSRGKMERTKSLAVLHREVAYDDIQMVDLVSTALQLHQWTVQDDMLCLQVRSGTFCCSFDDPFVGCRTCGSQSPSAHHPRPFRRCPRRCIVAVYH